MSFCTFCDGPNAKEISICYSHLRLSRPLGDYIECDMCGGKNYCISRYVCHDCMAEFHDGQMMVSRFRCRVCVMRNEIHPSYNCKSVCGECYKAFEERNGVMGKTLPKCVSRQDRRCCICRKNVVEYYLESCSVHH